MSGLKMRKSRGRVRPFPLWERHSMDPWLHSWRRRIAAMSVTVLVVVASLLAVGATATQAQAVTYQYGAFAYSPANHTVVAAGWGDSAVSAIDLAVSRCRLRANDCLPVASFQNSYGSFVVGDGTGVNQAWAWWRSGTSAQDADNSALNYCRTHGGGNCRVILDYATASPSNSATGGQDLVGRVCMVDAPNGADILGQTGPYGHVGWAYLVDRNQGTWTFGANEGVSFIGLPSLTWYKDAEWPELVRSFKAPDSKYSRIADYYKYTRCASGSLHNNSTAAATARSQDQQPYWIPLNDCLSNAVDVLRAYGVPSLPSYVITPQPNDYFNNGLNALPFEPVEPLR